MESFGNIDHLPIIRFKWWLRRFNYIGTFTQVTFLAGCNNIFPAHSATSAFRNNMIYSKVINGEMTLTILTVKTVAQENVTTGKIDCTFLIMILAHHHNTRHSYG